MTYEPFKNFRIHYKNMPYRILGVAKHSETLEELQLYEALYMNSADALWVRPKQMFEETVEVSGRRLARFRKVQVISEVPMDCFRQIKTPEFRTLQYLQSGSLEQRKVYCFLQDQKFFEILKDFKPILVGTFPLGLNVEGSDLDILCETSSWEDVESCLRASNIKFNKQSIQFQDQSSACVFSIEGAFPVEIFAQDTPTDLQRGYTHMIAEARFLRMGGCEAAAHIRELKSSGLKTEPAFARYFGISGDPYLALLEYGKSS